MGKPEVKCHLEELDVEGRIILRLGKYGLDLSDS